MDALSKFEADIGKPRSKWSKADWRMVAHKLAGVQLTKGRPTLSDEQKYESEQNLRAAEFWRDQAIEMESVLDGDVGKVTDLRKIPLVDGDVGMVINRKDKLRQNTATKELVREAHQRKGVELRGDKLDKKAYALTRAIQLMKQKNRREK